jgi:hypothetical protein
MRLLAEFKDGDCPVKWEVTGKGSHVITYGKQVDNFFKSKDLEASHCFGECVRHSLECASKFNS